jgi:hypothetical protein
MTTSSTDKGLPLLAPVRQTLTQSEIDDVETAAYRAWQSSPVAHRLPRGGRVAVAVGSRGIANLAAIVRGTLRWVHEQGCTPFVVAAMGSHGGATSEGQRQLLAEYGVNEGELGVPVMTDMTSVQIGINSWGEPVFWDRNAFEADAVLTLSRIKPHTDFRGKVESGITKMIVIGLGKREGASQHHRWGVRGLRDMLPETAKVVIERTPFVAGLAILENARELTARLQVVEKEDLLAVEPGLLDEARGLMGRLPFEQLDLLVIGELGKNYSGAGIDPNVVGRLLIENEREVYPPFITRICVLDLSPESHGNGTGVGIADLTTDRLLAAIDPVPFRMNNLTACFLWRSKLPIPWPTDRECIESGLATCWQPNRAAVRMAVIPNTLELTDLWVSPALLDEVRKHPHLEQTGDLQELPFDDGGNVWQEQLFPHSVRSRRAAALHG